MIVVPSSWGTATLLLEFNPCHAPAGGPQGGRFCSTADRVKAAWDAIHTGVSSVVTELMAKGGFEPSGRPHIDITVEEWHQEALLHNVKKDIARAIYDHPGLQAFYEAVAGTPRLRGTQKTQADYIAERVLTDWAVTSSRSSLSNALQLAATEVFRLDARPDIGEKGAQLYRDHASILHRIVRDQYDRTQRFFAERGIKEVTLLRGASTPAQLTGGSGGVSTPGQRRVRFNPLTSWTADHEVAERFGAQHLIVARLPVSEVFSTVRTGFGTLAESEYVTLGGSRTVKVYERKDWTWPPK